MKVEQKRNAAQFNNRGWRNYKCLHSQFKMVKYLCFIKRESIQNIKAWILISTEHRTMSGKKLSYAQRKLLQNGHSSLPEIKKNIFFMKLLIDYLLVQFFYIQNRNICLSKKISYQYFLIFRPAWDSLPSENTLYVIKLH